MISLIACFLAATLADSGAASDAPPLATLQAVIESTRLFVDANVNGKGPIRFLVATGGGGTLIDATVARELGLEPRPDGTVRLREIRFAPSVVLLDEPAVVRSLGPQADRRFSIGGIVGGSLLDRFCVTIDYPRSRIEIRDRNSAPVPLGFAGRDYWIVAERDSARGPAVPVVLDNAIPYSLVLDTATDHWCAIGYEPAMRAGPARSEMLVDSVALFGRFRVEMGFARLPSLEIASLVLRDVETRFPVGRDSLPREARFDSVGVLGGPVLRLFRITFDRARRQVTFERPPIGTGPPPPLSELDATPGFVAFRDERGLVRVSAVVPRSPASAAGVADGQLVHEIDKKPVDAMSVTEIENALYGAPGTVVEVVLGADEKSERRSLRLARIDILKLR